MERYGLFMSCLYRIMKAGPAREQILNGQYGGLFTHRAAFIACNNLLKLLNAPTLVSVSLLLINQWIFKF